MVNSKQKGGEFERTICKRLSLWISRGQREDLLWRAAMSGGRATVAAKKGQMLTAQAGDISCIHPMGEPFIRRFYCECKFYNNLQYSSLLLAKGNLANFWNTTKVEAYKYEKLPFMIAKQNRLPTTICTDTNGVMALVVNSDHVLMTVPMLDLYIIHADMFLNNSPFVPEDLSEAVN
ncbi:MAG TPA: hypothetical protein VFR24_27250 [Candidatus Angelobacter sp.]|nr:hypothetical protein [Candidatus Angelobacter sp.]